MKMKRIQSSLASAGKGVLCLWLAGLIWMAGIASSSTGLHRLLHGNEGDEGSGTEHHCVVSLFQNHLVEPSSDPDVFIQPPAFTIVATHLSEPTPSADLALAIHASRGPPA